MVSRRQVLTTSGGAAAALIASRAGATAPSGAGPALILLDTSIPGIAAAAEVAAGAGVAVEGFREDLGVPWLATIGPMWRNSPTAIAGITDLGALFCLEQLGRSHGMAVTLRLPAAERIEEAAGALLEAARHPPPLRRRAGASSASAPIAWLMQPVARSVR